jgi:RND family efflux transporter MFP subunit
MKQLKQVPLFLMLFVIASCSKRSEETTAQRRDITEMVFATGILEPENKYNLTAENDGYLSSFVVKEGEIVKQGQLIATIDNPTNEINANNSSALLAIAQNNVKPDAPTMLQVQANIAAAEEKVKQDELQETRYKKLAEENAVSKLEYENVKLALTNSKTNLAALKAQEDLLKQQAQQQLFSQLSQSGANNVNKVNNEIKAFVGGKIYSKKKEVGDYVRRGDVIAVIGNADILYAKLNIDEGNISKIKTGSDVLIQLNTDKSKTYKATVKEILPSFDETSQSFFCKAYFTEPMEFKIAGTQLQANIVAGMKKNALVVPRNFLGYGNKVIAEGNEINVKTGIVSSEWVEITEGLNDGEKVSRNLLK